MIAHTWLFRVIACFCAAMIVCESCNLLAAPPGTVPVDGLRENPSTYFAFVNATVVIEPGRQLEKATVVIRDGSIIAVASELTPPAGAIVFDLTGKRLYPGLMDSYSETQVAPTTAITRHWNSLVTPELHVADSCQPDAAANSKLRRQGVVCRLVAPDSGVIKGISCIMSTSDESKSQTLWKSSVAQHLKLGVPRNRSSRGFPSSPMGSVALARQTFLDADWYSRAWNAFRSKPSLPQPERNMALEALAESMDRGEQFVFDSVNELYLLRADDFAREFSLNAVIRGSGQEYQRLDAVQATGRPLIIPVDFPSPPSVDTPEAIHSVSLSELMHWDIAPENPARLYKAGVQFSFSTIGLEDLGTFLGNIRTSVDRGLPEDSALAALTTIPASLFGISDRFGTVTVGKSASFCITDGDLFAQETNILETWIDGKRFANKGTDDLDIRGSWTANVTLPDKSVHVREVAIKGKSDRLKGELKLPPNAEAATEQTQPEQTQPEPSGTVSSPNEEETKEAVDQQGENQSEQSKDDLKADSPKDEPKAKESEKDRQDIVEFTKLSLDDRRLTGSLPGKKLGQDGTIQLSATIIDVSGQPLRATGRMILPTGEIWLLTATRTIADKSDTDEKKLEEDSKVRSDHASDQPAENEAVEKQSEEKLSATESAGEGKPGKVVDDTKKTGPAEFIVTYPLGAFGRPSLPEQPTILVFQNAIVWTCGEAGRLEGCNVIVRSGQITDIGVDLPVPEGALVIDATGKHLTPGLIDCHSHMATDGGINEFTQAITAEVRVGDFINCDDSDIYRQLAGGITSANVLHGSANPIGGQNQVIKLRWGELYDQMRFSEAPPGIKFALGENVKRSNRPDGFNDRYPASRMGVEQLIRDAFQAAKDYQTQWQVWQRDHDSLPPRKDLELEALSEILRGERWVHCHSYRQDEILALLRTCEEYGIRIATLQHILEGYKVADAISRHGAMGSSFSDWWAYKVEVYDAIPYNGALMHQAGVVVSFNSDDRELARHMNHEAAKAIRYGNLEPEEALKFVTLNPAKQLRIDNYVGSIEVGKQADLVLWSGPPLSMRSRCEQTWVDGKRYFDIQEDLQMRATAHTQRNRLVQKVLSSGQTSKNSSERPRAEEDLWPKEDEFCRARNLR